MCKLSLAAKSHADIADNFSHRLSHQEIIKLFFVGLCWILAALTEDMPADRKNCTQLHRLLRCAMLGRVMMPIGTASCTACNTRFIISPSPSGLPYGLPFPFGINGRRLSIARASSFSAFGLHHWLVASTSWLLRGKTQPGSSRGTPKHCPLSRRTCVGTAPPCRPPPGLQNITLGRGGRRGSAVPTQPGCPSPLCESVKSGSNHR